MVQRINYPITAMTIVIMGKPAKWQRVYIMRPARKGKYALLVYPKGVMNPKYVTRFYFDADQIDGPPTRYVFKVPVMLKVFKNWVWELTKCPDQLAAPEGTSDSERFSLSLLLFRERAVAKGTFTFDSEITKNDHRIIAWSCNQPFAEAENESAVLNEEVAAGLFDWFESHVKKFDPHMIWGLGDTAYSDGCKPTNFVDQFYDHPNLLRQQSGQEELLSAYRRMYLSHWSFPSFQKVMRNYPHLSMWDDHEIRDGWGSEANDFARSNTILMKVATQVANEYILNLGPRVRPQEDNQESDAHQAYVEGDIAVFIFDGRSSRKYTDPGGKVISDAQMKDFHDFCQLIGNNPSIKYLIMGTAVPFINLKDFVEKMVSKAPKALIDLIGGMRDDVRDSWHSPGNIRQLKQLIQVLKKLHRKNSKLEIINVSGDIHVANLYAFQPLGFTRAIYQVTTSALSNREHPPDKLNELLTVGTESWSEALGLITRVWPTISSPNFLQMAHSGNFLRLTLKVFDAPQWNGTSEEPEANHDLTYEVGQDRFAFSHLLPI